MRLTFINFFKRSPNGHIFRGKNRLVREVTPLHKDKLRREFEQTELNMAYLLKPYLTLAESMGHSKALGKQEAMKEKWKKTTLTKKMKPHITIADRLACLEVKNAWE